jgi:hypothetical protein
VAAFYFNHQRIRQAWLFSSRLHWLFFGAAGHSEGGLMSKVRIAGDLVTIKGTTL